MALIQSIILGVILAWTACTLQGCGSSGGSNTPTTTTTTTTSTTKPPAPWHSLKPMKGIAYGALPCPPWGKPNCSAHSKSALPPEDMVQSGYEMEWGHAHGKGRDDLGAIRSLGGNTVRLYHSIGQDAKQDHSKFLDYAYSQGIHVLVGVNTDNTRECPEFDCHDVFEKIMTASFSLGFLKDKKWHPAISMVILLNEADFLGSDPKCPKGADGKGASWCRVKAVLSALDGTLTAEKKAGVQHPVNLTTTWSFGVYESIDKKVNGPGYFGFQDMEASTLKPSLADGYKPKNDVRAAYTQRWVHGVNVQAPFDYVWTTITAAYGPYNKAPWFIGELAEGNQPLSVMEKDLKDCWEQAKQDACFLGAATFQFQTAYEKGGSETHFGLFALGKTKLGEETICQSFPDPGDEKCETHEVYCTTDDLDFLDEPFRHRAKAVAQAWNGTVPKSRCKDSNQVLSINI